MVFEGSSKTLLLSDLLSIKPIFQKDGNRDFNWPILTWGHSKEDVKKASNGYLTFKSDYDTVMKYTNSDESVVYEFSFEDNKLSGVSMVIASENSSPADVPLKDELLYKNNNRDLWLSQDKTTFCMIDIAEGANRNYCVIGWYYIDPEKEEPIKEGPDFSPSGVMNGHEYVDLGLGVYWATCNVGASKPEDYGDFYMWGECSQHNDGYYWYNYSLYNGDKNGYFDESKIFTPNNDISGTNYDVVKYKWGEQWRMPTSAELASLVKNCNVTFGEINSVNGIIITGPSGKSLFIPKNGYKEMDSYYWDDFAVELWSSNNYQGSVAYRLEVTGKKGAPKINNNFTSKCNGLGVRGVISK